MILDDPTFKSLLHKLNTGSVNPVFFNYVAVLIDEHNNKIKVHNVLSLYTEANYDSMLTDKIAITLQMVKSDYLALLKVNTEKLKLQLTKTQSDLYGAALKAPHATTYTYSAKLTDGVSEAIETRIGGLNGTHSDDLGELVELHIELNEDGIMEFKLIEISGVFRNIAIGELLQGLFSTPVKRLNSSNKVGYNVTVYPVDNSGKKYQRKIDNGIRLVDLPNWMQYKWGIYSAGLGYYLTQGMWRFYPLYDITRYDKEKKRLTIINLPQNEMMGNHNSFVIENNETYIYTTGDTKHINRTDYSLEQTGGGVRTAIAGNIFNKFTVNDKGTSVIPTDRNMVTVSFDGRESDLNNIRTSKNMVTSNVWNEASKVIAGMGNIIILKWEHSDHSLLYSGMPVKFIYKYRDTVYSLKGTLLRAATEVSTPMASVLDTRYISNTKLMIYTERADK